MPSILDHSKYKINLVVQDSYSGKIYDLAPGVESIIWQTHRIASQPGTLEVLIKEGLKETDMIIHPGSPIRFGVNGKDYFYGNIEEPEITNSALEGVGFRIKANDHLKLLKNTLSIYREKGMTASGFFDAAMTKFDARIRAMGDPGINWAVLEPSVAMLDDYYFAVTTLYTMFKKSMTNTHIAEMGQAQYMIRDNLGTIEWRELQALRTPYILGDSSYTSNYTYANTLDGSYNVIRVFRDNEEIGMRDVWTKYDSTNIGRWRARELTIEAEEHMTDAEISDKIDLFLESKNRTNRTMKMLCVGVNGLQAGDGVQIRTARARIDHAMWLESVTHTYSTKSHIMDLELFVPSI